MRSLNELRESLIYDLGRLGRAHEAREFIVINALHDDPIPVAPSIREMAANAEPLLDRIWAALRELAQHDSDEAVEIIRCEVLCYKFPQVRQEALTCLATMTAPRAVGVVRASARWFALVPRQEKRLARALLQEMNSSQRGSSSF